MPIPYDDLDPGIRETVRWLNTHGFDTHDSGDGVTKFANADGCAMSCAMSFPNVTICVAADALATECDRLVRILVAQGVAPEPMGPEIVPGLVHIQGSYDPTIEPEIRSFIQLLGLDDALLGVCRG